MTAGSTGPGAAGIDRAVDERGPDQDRTDDQLPTNIRVLNAVCVGLACVLLATIECFLLPLRAGTVPIPVSFVLVVAGNVLMPVMMRWATGIPLFAAAPAALWFVVTLLAATRTSEGDLVVTGTTYDLAFLLVGALSAAFGVRAVRHPLPWGSGAARKVGQGAAR